VRCEKVTVNGKETRDATISWTGAADHYTVEVTWPTNGVRRIENLRSTSTTLSGEPDRDKNNKVITVRVIAVDSANNTSSSSPFVMSWNNGNGWTCP
jgi:hypothetical protein